MLTKKDFLKYASILAFPIMLQNLIGTLVNIADTVMLGYVSQTAMSASSLANQYTFILFCLYYGMATGTSVLCAQYWGKGDKKTVEKILGLAERISLIISLIFFVISFTMPTAIMKIFTNSPETIAAGSEYLKVISFSFVFMGFSQIFMSALRSIGKIMLPSVTYIVSLCVNVFCNASFIWSSKARCYRCSTWYCDRQNLRSADLSDLFIAQFRRQIQNKILLCKIRYSVTGLYKNCHSGGDK